MRNQKVSTGLGTIVLVIIAITVGVVAWKIVKNREVTEAPQEVAVQPKPVEKNQEQQKTETLSNTDKNNTIQQKTCSEELNERVCLNGTTTKKINSGCNPVYCPAIVGNDAPYLYSPYVKQEDRIYFENRFTKELEKIDNADIKTFTLVGSCASVEMSGSYYGKDKNNLYVNTTKIGNVDVKSFKYLGSFSNGDGMPYSVSVANDKNHVFFACGTEVDSINKDTFKLLGSGYFKDKNGVYYLHEKLDKADPKSFEIIKYQKTNELYGNWALDSKYTYFEGTIVKGVDPLQCKNKGLQICLPNNWHELVDTANGGGTRVEDNIY